MVGYLLMSGIDERGFFVLEEFEGGLVDSAFRIEIERDSRYYLSHADDRSVSDELFGLGSFDTAEACIEALIRWETSR